MPDRACPWRDDIHVRRRRSCKGAHDHNIKILVRKSLSCSFCVLASETDLTCAARLRVRGRAGALGVAKMSGAEVEEPAEPVEVVDLMAALEASIRDAGNR